MLQLLLKTFSRRRLIIGFWALLALTLATALLDVHAMVEDKRIHGRRMDSSRIAVVDQIHDSVMLAKDLVDSFVLETSLGTNAPDLDKAKRELGRRLAAHPGVLGAGLALDPAWIRRHPQSAFGTKADSLGEWSYHVFRGTSPNRTEMRLGYDYTDTSLDDARWYTSSSRLLAPVWCGPYFSKTSKTSVLVFSRPVIGPDRQLVGVVRAVYSLGDLRTKIAMANIDHDGYSTLMSEDGTVLYHPRMELMDGKSTIGSIGEKTNSPALLEFADSIKTRSPSGSIGYRSLFTGESARLRYSRIRGLGWYVLSVVPDSGSKPFCAYQKHIFLFLFAGIVLLGWGWSLLWHRHLWVAAMGVSIFFSLGIVGFCWLSVAKFESGICTPLAVLVERGAERNPSTDCSRTPLSNAFAASAFMNRCFELDGRIRSIPTGILIQTVNITSAYSFSASGYVWQKYRNTDDTSRLGVDFPETESLVQDIAYDDSIALGERVRGWKFSLSIRQPFDYHLYPLDKQEIWFRMRPKGLDGSLMLEPDFTSYRQQIGSMFGIDQNLVIPQWMFLATNFSYARNQSSTNFGRGVFENGGNAPELYFSIHVRRNIFDAFISQFIPLMVILLMLFSILWVGRKKDERGLLGFNALSGASGCSAVFFIVIFSHISLRNTLGSPGVLYMESYYFLTYAGILFVSLNSILVALDHRSRFINLGDNMISRLIYWPLITGVLFVWTFVTFL